MKPFASTAEAVMLAEGGRSGADICAANWPAVPRARTTNAHQIHRRFSRRLVFVADLLPLYARRAAPAKRPNLLQRRHGRVARKRGQQRAMRPAQLKRFFWRLARQQSVEEPGGEAVSAAYAVENVQIAGRRNVRMAVDPRHRAPTVLARRMDFTQRGRYNLDPRMLLHHLADHAKKSAWV